MAKRTRDPEGRKNAILRATGELIREIGISAVTHRKVAERAKVSLGSTTQYFDSLADLVAEALTAMAEEREEHLRQVGDDFARADDVVPLLVSLVESSVEDPTRLRNEISFWLLYAMHPKLNHFLRSGDDALLRALANVCSPDRARAVVVHIYGTMLHAATHDEAPNRTELEASLRRLLGPRPPEPSPEGP